MAAYVIADITVQDKDRYDEYRSQVLATIEKYGGRFLVRGGTHQSAATGSLIAVEGV